MEIRKTVLSAETLAGSASAQAQLESAIPLPGGVRSEKVLSCEPEVRVRETLCTRDGVQVTGLLLLHLVVETDANKPLSFDASATFTHELSLPGALPEMTARAAAYAPACTCRMEEGGLRMQATLLLNADVFATVRETCVAGVDDAKGLETQGESVRLVRRTLLGAHAIRLQETVDAPENLSLLKTSGTAEIGRIANGASGMPVEGTLTVTALFYDDEGGAVSRVYAIPFTDTIDAEANPQPNATAEVTQLEADYDADGELAIEAVLSLGVYGVAEENAWVLSDAYDSEGSFSCETKSLLLLSIVYRADDGRLYGFRTDLPFSLPLEPFGTLLLPSVTVRSAQAAGSGRTLSCTVDLKYGGEWYRQETALFTTDLRPGVPRDPHEGILVYFPDRGETVFSIGKRFGVPTSVIRAQNPTLSEPIPDGAHVLLLRK